MSPWELAEHLSDRDIEFLAPGRAEELRRDPRLLAVALESPELYARLKAERDPLLRVSPFVLFGVLVRQAVRDLRQARFTVERSGLRGRVVVFDAPRVRAFLDEPGIVDYLAELLASFTRVYSGSWWRRTPAGWRRRRFSELDLRSLEALHAEAGEEERFWLDRRMGEVALFLVGVFPDAVRRPRLHGRTAEELEAFGAEHYERAAQHPLAERSGLAGLLGQLAARFTLARKALNFVTDHYLYPLRADWFPTV
jgi:hypothetical protein